MTEFCKNLKRLRQAKKLTQDEAARFLGVSSQSVSRWECGTTLPDVTMLPEIARLYCVTIDELYRPTSGAYDNYAHRLGCLYEATGAPEDFLRADHEFRKLINSGEYTTEDLRLYGILHQYMMQYSMEKAEQLFDRVLEKGPEENPEVYWSIQRQKGHFLWQIGRNREVIDCLRPKVEAGSGEVQEWICLIQAYTLAEMYEDALKLASSAAERFPENASVHIYTGDLLQKMGHREKAFCHWRRALEMEPEWLDPAYSMALCYEEMEEYAKAAETWENIAMYLAGRGFDVETNWPRTQAEKCRKKLHK